MKTACLAFLIVTGLGTCAFAQGTNGSQTTTITTNYIFPPVGLSSGETIAVNLVNIATAPTNTSSSSANAPSCTGTVTFTNASGAVINSGLKPTAFTVGTGAIDTVSLAFVNSGITASRGEVLASVQQTTTRPSSTPCSLVFSLEVYDATGDHVFLGNAQAATPTTQPVQISMPIR